MQRNNSILISSPLFFFFFFFLVSCSISTIVVAMADTVSNPSAVTPAATAAAVHIVYTERPPQDEEPESFHIRTLITVLGSEEAARDALVYSYKTAASGFSAKLTPDQVSEISKQPGVLQVVPSRTLQLHSGTARLH